MGKPPVPEIKVTPDEVYQYLEDYINKHGYAPAYREIAGDLEVSVGTVFNKIKELEGMGWIRKVPEANRAIKLLKE